MKLHSDEAAALCLRGVKLDGVENAGVVYVETGDQYRQHFVRTYHVPGEKSLSRDPVNLTPTTIEFLFREDHPPSCRLCEHLPRGPI